MSVSLSDCLGSTVFSVIKSDINGNITVRYQSVIFMLLLSASAIRHLNVTWSSVVQLSHANLNVHAFFLFFSSQKIKGVYLKDPAKYVTLQDIVEAEREAHAAEWPKVGATLALMWLKR